MTYNYQIGFIGDPNNKSQEIQNLLKNSMEELGVLPENLHIYTEKDIVNRNRKLPFVAIFFGYTNAEDQKHPILQELIDDAVLILPVVDDLKNFSSNTPKSITHINGIETKQLDRIVTVIMENFRLLRPERRLFISYKREESQSIAIQLYEKFGAAGFDVFLDTHSVAPAENFQDRLWHSLADSDIMVLLDTENYRNGRWTKEELAKANTTSIQILHLLWPNIKEDPNYAFSKFTSLSDSNFSDSNHLTGDQARLKSETLDAIVNEVESLRARALAARYQHLITTFYEHAKEHSLATTIQAERFLSCAISTNEKVAVVPAIGVPTAERYEQIETLIKNISPNFSKIWLLYDERGILKTWIQHLDWLNNHLPLKAVKASEAQIIMKKEAR